MTFFKRIAGVTVLVLLAIGTYNLSYNYFSLADESTTAKNSSNKTSTNSSSGTNLRDKDNEIDDVCPHTRDFSRE